MSDANDFFTTTTAPNSLVEIERKVGDFVEHCVADSDVSRCVIVTSGGTMVPLEQNTVRFLDNFSTGNRGSKSTEYFLKHGYYVIFLHRRGSIVPFARHVSASMKCRTFDSDFLANVRLSDNDNALYLSNEAVSALRDYKEVVKSRRLCMIEYQSLIDYLFCLRSVATLTSALKSRVMFYLAAAVSDFYIPEGEQVVHKIQSRAGPLELTLQPTPKLLGLLKNTWAPQSMCYSFKLETDRALLLPKSRNAIEKYGMDGVIANELHTRNYQVTIVYANSVVEVALDQQQQRDCVEIEEQIVAELVNAHANHISNAQ